MERDREANVATANEKERYPPMYKLQPEKW